jgi:ribonuclease-3
VAVGNPLVAAVQGNHLSEPHDAGGDAWRTAAAILGHDFNDPKLLREALTHRSAAHGPGAHGPGARRKGAGSNERLEFVGDRVLGLLIAEWLAERFPREQEGELGRRLAYLVSQPVLATIGADCGLPAVLAVAPGESRAGVRRRATVLADAMEAALGALYLDGGIAPARRFVRQAWEAAMAGQVVPPKDPKTALQEWAQARGQDLPAYRIVSREGPPHSPRFVVAVAVGEASGTGAAGTRRAAEQAAARDLLSRLAA